MFPTLFGTIPTFTVVVVIGIFAAVLLFRFLCTKFVPDTAVYNFYATNAIASIAVGLVFALLFQSVYDWIDSGFTIFKLEGVTFMGGLIGGAACFIIITLLAKAKNRREFWRVASVATPCLVLGHAIGRIGCFCAGCCYGKVTDSFLGVLFVGETQKRLPTQLFEAIFLFALFAVLLFLLFKTKRSSLNLIVYGLSYSIFRFIIEFFRDDPRGFTFLSMSPSQWQSVVLFAVSLALLYLVAYKKIIPFAKAKDNKPELAVDSGETVPTTLDSPTLNNTTDSGETIPTTALDTPLNNKTVENSLADTPTIDTNSTTPNNKNQ